MTAPGTPPGGNVGSGEKVPTCEWLIDSAGPRHGEPCGCKALAHVRFLIDRHKGALGKTLHRKVCGRHLPMAVRAGWNPRSLSHDEVRFNRTEATDGR